MQIKTTMDTATHHFKRLSMSSAGEDVKELEISHTAVGM